MQVVLIRIFAAMLLTAASAAVADAPAGCTTPAERAAGLRYARTAQTLADLGLAIPAGQEAAVRFAGAVALDGPCARNVHSYLGAQVGFADGATFNWNARTGQFDYIPRIKAMHADDTGRFGTRPAIAGATFIMSAAVDGQGGTPGLDVGLWQTGADYLVAAFIRRDGGFSAPIELVRSRHPIRSLTYFPAPDANLGNLSMVEEMDSGIALLTFYWDHDALSRRSRQ